MRVNTVTALGAAIIAITSIGIGTAAGAGIAAKGVKACVTNYGYLRTATGGHCPKHTTKVTIAKQGPVGKTGPAGPGAKAAQVNAANNTKTVTLHLATGDTIVATCDATVAEGTPTIVITPPKGATTQLMGPGEVQDDAPEAFFDLSYESATNNLVNSDYSSDKDFFAQATYVGPITISVAPGNSLLTTAWAHLLFTRGSGAFTLDLNYYGEGKNCQLSLQATPAT